MLTFLHYYSAFILDIFCSANIGAIKLGLKNAVISKAKYVLGSLSFKHPFYLECFFAHFSEYILFSNQMDNICQEALSNH